MNSGDPLAYTLAMPAFAYSVNVNYEIIGRTEDGGRPVLPHIATVSIDGVVFTARAETIEKLALSVGDVAGQAVRRMFEVDAGKRV